MSLRPYYEDERAGIRLFHGDAREVVPALERGLTVTDPPYNVGYHHGQYSDRLKRAEYVSLLRSSLRLPAVVIHYPEGMFDVAEALDSRPVKVVAWVYHANTPRQWRTVAWFGTEPDFSAVLQPYKNPGDRRIAARIAGGQQGTPVYDWWHIEQVKNVCAEKTAHPCQIPEALMRRVLAVTTAGCVTDPFAGSGTTLVAAKQSGMPADGVELDEAYCEIAARRLQAEPAPLFAGEPQAVTLPRQEALAL